MNCLYLAKWIQTAWDQYTPTLFQAGFELLGDYRLKPEPIENHNRFFLSDTGDMLADVWCLLARSGVELTSVLEDGTVVATSSVANPWPERSVEPADRLHVLYLPGVPLPELVKQHRDILHRLAIEIQADVVQIDSDTFQRVALHDQRVCCRWRYRHNELDQPPPLPDFKQFAAMPTVSVSEQQLVLSERNVPEAAKILCDH